MSDSISRQAAIDALEQIFDRCEEIEAHLPEGDPDRTGYKMYPDYMTVWKYLHQLPSAQPERKTGRWIESNPQDSKVCRLMTCSECGKAYIVNINIPYEDWTEAHKFCVECGADMRGKTE